VTSTRTTVGECQDGFDSFSNNKKQRESSEKFERDLQEGTCV